MAVPGPIPWDVPAVTRRALDANEAAFAQLFDEYSSPIFNYVLRMVGDSDRAADITQDTFIKAYRKLDTVNEATSTRSWLYRIATNTAIDDMRRRRMVRPMGDDAPTFANRPDHRPGPEAQVMAATLGAGAVARHRSSREASEKADRMAPGEPGSLVGRGGAAHERPSCQPGVRPQTHEDLTT